jgi:hypothetical protein
VLLTLFRRFVPDFAVMVKPIHNLLKQDRSFSWTDDVENSFVGIKKAISSAPVLAKPDFEKEFMIYTNATEEAVSAILMQCDDQGNEKPVAYMSQSLSDDEFKYSFIEKHAFSLVKVVENFRHFILGKHTLVKVPLPAVKFLLSQTYLSGKLAHWLAKIQEHDLTIMTSNTIKGRDLALHLAQHVEIVKKLMNMIALYQHCFTLTIKSFLCLNILGIKIWFTTCKIKDVQIT